MAKYILLVVAVNGVNAETMKQFSDKKYQDLEEATAHIRSVFQSSKWRLYPLSDFQDRWNEGTTVIPKNHYLTPDSSYIAVVTIKGEKKKGVKNG